jgi:hypothetical protein
MGAVRVLLGEKLADLDSSGSSSGRGCDGGLDDGGQVEDFFALLFVSAGGGLAQW